MPVRARRARPLSSRRRAAPRRGAVLTGAALTRADLNQGEAADRAGCVEVESYDVFLDLTVEPVRSRTEIRFRWRGESKRTFADLRAHRVVSVTLDGAALPPPEDGRLRLERGGDEAVLVAEAEVAYSADGRGLSRFTDLADGAGYISGNSYPDCGPEMFCCFDQPDMTATFRFSVRLPDGWECVATGPVSGIADGVCAFEPVTGSRPYDLAFCAGPFTTAARVQAGGTEVTIRHRRSLAGTAAVASLPRFLDYARQAIGWYEENLGVPCPYPAYDIVFTPDLAATALSVPGLMVVHERRLSRAGAGADLDNAGLVAHEVAHLWFGCLVGPRWWDDVWLDEAIATYLSYAALAAITGTSETEAWAEYAYTDKLAAYLADDLPSRMPVSSPVATARQGRDKPYGILYVKGASVIRALGALIGDEALRAGLREYLTRFGPGSATLDDLIGCWSEASGRDLTGWGHDWLRTEGVPTIWLDDEGAVRQDMPRWHRVGIGLFDRGGHDWLRRRKLLTAELDGERTAVRDGERSAVPELASAAAVVLNDQDLSCTRVGFHERSMRVLIDVACHLDDPLTEAVCWNGFWLLMTGGQVPPGVFADMVCRRLEPGDLPRGGVETLPRSGAEALPRSGVEALLRRAVEAADLWTDPASRAELRAAIAHAARHEIDTIDATDAGGAAGITRALAVGVASSAQTDWQLAMLNAWLAGADLPDGLTIDADLRARILWTLAARGEARDADIDALPELDPVTGEVNRAVGLAMRPTAEAKEAAWTAALFPGTPARIAEAHATGLWTPGQEELMAGYRDRYFTEALPRLAGRPRRPAQRLSRLLFPSILVSEETIEASAGYAGTGVIETELADQIAIMRRRLAVRSGNRRRLRGVRRPEHCRAPLVSAWRCPGNHQTGRTCRTNRRSPPGPPRLSAYHPPHRPAGRQVPGPRPGRRSPTG
ncbi:MAG: ERAP1-like C-terminal domain-containing protein, partial [Nocardiopsaceae bacterium]|nr:ERAP1-like C-terminal domain-containing protein [Nocardiopsaceae bacterium]